MPEFEERADQLPLDTIGTSLADGQIFKNARKKLLSQGAKLLVGPRGTGKTHLMRYTYLKSLKNRTAPIVLYASFNRYLNLEPLLKKSPDALKRFHSWVIAKLILSAFQYLHDAAMDLAILENFDPKFNESKLKEFISLIERGSGLELYESFGKDLTIDDALKAANLLIKICGKERAVFLLDDAALSLSDQYLVAFFEIFRLLKTEKISPKASVYPGSTQYGATFHAPHEAQEIPLWLSIDDPEYSHIMGDIASRRLSAIDLESLNPEILEQFKYISFGIPRVLLRLIREYLDTPTKNSQQKINKIIEDQANWIGAEYDSLALKIKQFSSLIKSGKKLFDKIVMDVSATQSNDLNTRNFTIGIKQESERSPLADRMMRFLIEVGLLYPLPPVSHGAGRKYDRYIPHFAFLYQQGAFREGRGTPLKAISNLMSNQTASAKHPIRRDMTTLVPGIDLKLKLDLPACQKCGTARINDSQRFCHFCGEQLVESSLFEECMNLELKKIPGISEAIVKRITTGTQIRTIGDIYSSQNASADLQQADYVGPTRASNITQKVILIVDEFLS